MSNTKVMITKNKIDTLANGIIAVGGGDSTQTLDELSATMSNVIEEIDTQEDLIAQLLEDVNNLPENSGGITPSGNINITSTDTIDVTNYATAKVVDSNLVAANVKSGTSILGVNGTFTNDATAAAANILSGKTAYSKGEKITGNIATYDGSMTNGIEHICSGGGGSSIKTCNVTIDTDLYNSDKILYCSALVFDNNALSHYIYSDENNDDYTTMITIPNVVCGSIIVINSNIFLGKENGVGFFIEGTAVGLNIHSIDYYDNFILTIQAPLEQSEECKIAFACIG